MNIKQALASVALTGTLALIVPAAPTYADGAASTRNLIFLGVGAAATAIIINHNRKVHEKYAEDARRQAYLEEQDNNMQAAYDQEQRAYNEQVAVNQSLRKEIAYQHSVVDQQKKQLAMLNSHGFVTQHVARVETPGGQPQQVAMVSYGWGAI
jgi:ABC-type Fe2+-enterobactin transport system substrate-binding protein